MGLLLEGLSDIKVLDLAQRSKHVEFRVLCGSDAVHFGIYDADLVKKVSAAWDAQSDQFKANNDAIEVVRDYLKNTDCVVRPACGNEESNKKTPHTFNILPIKR